MLVCDVCAGSRRRISWIRPPSDWYPSWRECDPHFDFQDESGAYSKASTKGNVGKTLKRTQKYVSSVVDLNKSDRSFGLSWSVVCDATRFYSPRNHSCGWQAVWLILGPTHSQVSPLQQKATQIICGLHKNLQQHTLSKIWCVTFQLLQLEMCAPEEWKILCWLFPQNEMVVVLKIISGEIVHLVISSENKADSTKL